MPFGRDFGAGVGRRKRLRRPPLELLELLELPDLADLADFALDSRELFDLVLDEFRERAVLALKMLLARLALQLLRPGVFGK